MPDAPFDTDHPVYCQALGEAVKVCLASNMSSRVHQAQTHAAISLLQGIATMLTPHAINHQMLPPPEYADLVAARVEYDLIQALIHDDTPETTDG